MNESLLLEKETEKANMMRTRPQFVVGMMLFVGFIFARNIMNISIPIILILAIASLVALLSNRNEIIALAISCIPTSSAFQYKYLLLVIIVVYLLKFGRDVKYTACLLPLVLMFLWELLHGIGYEFSIYQSLRDFSELFLCTVLMMCEHKRINYPMIVRVFSLTTVCMFSIVLIHVLRAADFDFEAVFEGTYRFGAGNLEAENYGVNYNANEVGLIASVSLSTLSQLILAKKQRVIDYLLIAATLFFGVITMSRAFLLCSLLIVLLFIFSFKAHFLKKIKFIIILVLVLVIALIAIVNFMPSVVEKYEGRFHEEDITGGRTDIFDFYGEHIMSNLETAIFGVGVQDYQGKVADIHQIAINPMFSCHNGTQEIVVCWGFVGLILFFAFIATMIWGQKVTFRRSVLHFIPLIVLLTFVQSIQLLHSGRALLCLPLAYISLMWNEQ